MTYVTRVTSPFTYTKDWPVFSEVSELFILVPMLLALKGNLEMNLAARLSTAANMGYLDIDSENTHKWVENDDTHHNQHNPIARRRHHQRPGSATPRAQRKLRWQILVGNLYLLQVQAIVIGTVAGIWSWVLGIVVQKQEQSQQVVGAEQSNGAAGLSEASVLHGDEVKSHVKPVLHDGWWPIVAAMVISSVAGVFLEEYINMYSGLALLVPVLNGIVGNVSSIYACRISTDLHIKHATLASDADSGTLSSSTNFLLSLSSPAPSISSIPGTTHPAALKSSDASISILNEDEDEDTAVIPTFPYSAEMRTSQSATEIGKSQSSLLVDASLRQPPSPRRPPTSLTKQQQQNRAAPHQRDGELIVKSAAALCFSDVENEDTAGTGAGAVNPPIPLNGSNASKATSSSGLTRRQMSAHVGMAGGGGGEAGSGEHSPDDEYGMIEEHTQPSDHKEAPSTTTTSHNTHKHSANPLNLTAPPSAPPRQATPHYRPRPTRPHPPTARGAGAGPARLRSR
ncbi:hypothetical protein HK102_003744, partial [Quaeritorhiza haematococci]